MSRALTSSSQICLIRDVIRVLHGMAAQASTRR
jgi:hypothetical protein